MKDEINNSWKFLCKNFFFSYFIVVLFFPFFIKIEIYFIKIYLKDLLTFFFIFFLFYFKNLFNNKEKTQIFKILLLLIFIYILSFVFITFKFSKIPDIEITLFNIDLYLQKYISLLFRSICIVFGGISLYFISCKLLDQKKLIEILKVYYFICLIIILEFFISFILIEINSKLTIINKIYDEDVFRSIFLNGHIVTSIFLSVGLFVGIYLNKKLKYKFLNSLNTLFLLPILYNVETRLTILAFFYVGLIYFFIKYLNLSSIKLKIHLPIYASFIASIIFFSQLNNIGTHEIALFNLSIGTESLFDRININIISFFAFLNYPFGFGFEMFTPYLDILFIPSIHLGDFNYLELYGGFILYQSFEFLEIHRSFGRPHGSILNFLTSFGIFIFPLYYLIKSFNKMQKKFSYDINLYILIKCSVLFIILSSLTNYTFDIEILCILIAVLFSKMKEIKNEK
jgi:hypothetical protein